MKNIATNAISLVDNFFAEIKHQDEITLPSVLKSPGRWIASYDNSILGVFYLDRVIRDARAERALLFTFPVTRYCNYAKVSSIRRSRGTPSCHGPGY